MQLRTAVMATNTTLATHSASLLAADKATVAVSSAQLTLRADVQKEAAALKASGSTSLAYKQAVVAVRKAQLGPRHGPGQEQGGPDPALADRGPGQGELGHLPEAAERRPDLAEQPECLLQDSALGRPADVHH